MRALLGELMIIKIVLFALLGFFYGYIFGCTACPKKKKDPAKFSPEIKEALKEWIKTPEGFELWKKIKADMELKQNKSI
jgi:hypothetical protein